MVKPSTVIEEESVNREIGKRVTIGPDELVIQWGNVPRTTQATLFFPEVQADEILSLSALREHPAVLSKAMGYGFYYFMYGNGS